MLSPAADYVLTMGVARATDILRTRFPNPEVAFADAVRSLTLAADAANLIDVAERARIVGTERD